MFYVFVITHEPTGRKYIGRTTNPSRRWYKLSARACAEPHSAIGRAIHQLGAQEFAFQILEECSSLGEACAVQTRWIEKLDTNDPERGFNRTNYIHIRGSGTRRAREIQDLVRAQQRDAEEDRFGLRTTIAQEWGEE